MYLFSKSPYSEMTMTMAMTLITGLIKINAAMNIGLL